MKILNYPMKMIDFVSTIYGNFKVLNRLSEKESLEFQREIVTLLVDSKENVNQQTLQSLTEQSNIEGLVLDVLAKVINRTPFKNQFQLNRNLATITDNIKKDQQEIQKRQKVLDRKEQKLKSIEDSMINSIKQKIQALENESIQRILKKQGEIKKNISQLLNQLKAKEKIVIEKYEENKSNNKLLTQIEQREKTINEKLKLLEKRQKQLKSKDIQSQSSKKETEIQQYRQQVERLKQNLKEATKRYKNLEMAYKKIKNEKTKQTEAFIRTENPPKMPLQNKKQLNLDELDLSGIHQSSKNHECQELITYMNFEEAAGKLESIKNIITKSSNDNKMAPLSEIKLLLKLNHIEEPQRSQISHSSSEQDKEDSEEYMPKCLEPTPVSNSIGTLAKIKGFCLETDEDKQNFIKCNTLLGLIDVCYELNSPYQVCEALLQKILELIQQSNFYMEIIQYLAADKVIQFLQHVYLSHETNNDIIETTTLILSRIKLKDFELKLSNSFVKALQIRLKVQNKGSFLYGNINFILN